MKHYAIDHVLYQDWREHEIDDDRQTDRQTDRDTLIEVLMIVQEMPYIYWYISRT